MAPVVSIAFILFSVFEVLNASQETGTLLGLLTKNESKGLIVLSVIALAVTAMMALHHHKLTQRVEEHQRFLGSLRGLTEEAVRLSLTSDPDAGIPFIEQRALQTLSEWRTTKRDRKLRFATTLLETIDLGETFRMVCQWPPNTYNFDADGLSSPCAAQKSVEYSRLIYVPRTCFSHGVQLQWSTSRETFTNADLAEDAFVDLPSKVYNSFRPKSTICFMIPADTSKSIRYVICLDSASGNPFKLVDFEAVHMIGSVVARVINDMHKQTGSPSLVRVRGARP